LTIDHREADQMAIWIVDPDTVLAQHNGGQDGLAVGKPSRLFE
jgi:hypothetical protein